MTKHILFSTDVDWRNLSWEKPVQEGKVIYYKDLPYRGTKLLRKSIKLFYSWRINCKFRVPFRRILYKGILKSLNIKSGDEVKIIFYDRSRASYDFSFIKYLRKKIPNVKIGYLFSDIVAKSGAQTFGIVNSLNKYYDKVFSFDKKDAEKYDFDYSYLIYDRNILDNSNFDVQNDVFLVAQAKNRLQDLLKVCDKCFLLGLKTDFAINKIPEDKLVLVGQRKIQINEFIPYNEVVSRLLRSKCIIDIMQQGSVGITLNIVEAVVFNKKSISNNLELINEPFYDPTRILVFNDEADIKAFLDTPMKSYSERDRYLFSGTRLFDRL